MVTSIDRNLNLVMNLKDNATKELQNFRGQLERMQPTFQKMAAIGTATFVGVAAGIGKTVQAAGKAQEIERNFDLIFDKTNDRMTKFTENFADEFGRATSSIQASASDMGLALMQGTNLGEDASADMTEDLVLAATALAAMDPKIENTEQAMYAFSSAMNGSNQQLQQYIPTIRESIIEEKAMEMGLIKEGEALDRTNRAIALKAEIMDGTRLSQKALKEGSEDFDELLRRLKGTFKELVESLGKEFLPMMENALKKIIPYIEKVGEWIEENSRLVKWIVIAILVISGLIAIIGLLGLACLAAMPLIGAIGFMIGFLSLPILLIVGLIAILAAEIAYFAFNWKEHWETIKWTVEIILEKLSSMFETAKENIMSFLQPIIDAAERAIELAKRAKELAGGFVSGAISRISPFAEGGIVTRPTLGLVGEAGPEAIIPLNKAGGLGLTVNINGGFFGSDAGEEIGDQIIKKLKLANKL